MKQVTVVIPNWNGMKYLKTCLDSLRAQDTGDFTTLVVDNGSEDGSAAFIRENYPEVRLIEHPENLGFSGGVNSGISACETPYVLLLNNDVECAPGFVSGLLRAIGKDPRIFSVSARMVNYRQRELLDDCGDLYTVLGWQAQRGVGQPVSEPRYMKEAEVFSACAGAALYRRAVFDEIGLFDLQHFAYLEDIDVGYRAKLYGYRNVYTPEAVVYHIGSAASGAVRYSDFKVRISARNSIYLAYKNMPLLQRAVNAFPMWVGRKVKQRFFRKEGFEKAYLEGVKEGFATRKTTKKVPFRLSRLPRYFAIEWALIVNTFTYFSEYMRRHSR
ncbi:MAG: glycosyltransferase family 2 protein [Lachnospiraceae bacterium]|nr:glycosyltransferase family 2 protein [Lachnospiraceae bacterium]